MPKIEKEYVETGKLKYVTRDFPLDSIHKFARKASEAFWCANDQDKGPAMHQRMFENQRALQPEALEKYATELGLDIPKFKSCLDGDTYAAKVETSLKEGQKVGVTGTPAFILGYTQAGGTEVKAVKFISGAQPFNNFKEQIDKLLEGKD